MSHSSIQERYQRVMERIHNSAARSHRDPASIRLIAVTKTVSPERIRVAAENGVREIGENRLQEALSKKIGLQDLPLRWHFIGHLQTNKARKIVENFDVIQSVDRIDLAEKLNFFATSRLPVLVEVELGNEETKSGISERELPQLVEHLNSCERLDVRGFMAIPPFFDDVEASRPYFAKLRTLAERFKLSDLSMGMSHDFEIAIEEGATMVRVGTALFGARN